MAGLDDFFAKRDKGKKKKKDKFTPAELLEKQAEQVEAGESEAAAGATPQEPAQPWGAMVSEPAAGGEPAQAEADEVVTPAPAGEEWRDFDEDTPDYSGLRVQNMQLSAPEANGDEEDEAEEEEGAEGAAPGPWKDVQAPAAAAPAPAAAAAEEEAALPGVAAGRYVPPSLRNRPAAGAVPTRGGKRNKAAPNIGSQDDFPTLGDRPPSEEAGALKAAGFERVSQQKGGARYAEEQSSRIELGNKFGALQAGTD